LDPAYRKWRDLRHDGLNSLKSAPSQFSKQPKAIDNLVIEPNGAHYAFVRRVVAMQGVEKGATWNLKQRKI
jgi:hypothetical protein